MTLALAPEVSLDELEYAVAYEAAAQAAEAVVAGSDNDLPWQYAPGVDVAAAEAKRAAIMAANAAYFAARKAVA